MRKRSIHSLLLKTLILMSIMTLGLSSVIYSIMQYMTLRDQSIQDMQTSCDSIAMNLGQKVSEMDTILLYSIVSTDFKNTFDAYLNAQTSFEKLRERQKLAGIMMSLKGFGFSIRQLNAYDVSSGGYGVGNYNGALSGSVNDKAWYEAVVESAGRKYIGQAQADAFISRSVGVDDDTQYFSLYRMFYDHYHVPMGFLEVKAYYDEVFFPLKNIAESLDPVIAVYTQDGRQIYPKGEVFPYDRYISKTTSKIINTYTGEEQYLCFARDENNGLIVAMAVDNDKFMEPVYDSLKKMVLAVVVILVICLMLSAIVSHRLSDPIRRIYTFLSDNQKDRFKRIDQADTNILEIDKLRDSINDSIQMQENTTQTMLTLKEQEMQARMLALQSQMNPHFLYNSLTMIGEMADNGMTDQVSGMCDDITAILRYISSDSEQRIRVEEEMEQVDRYLLCMSRRFGDGLKYTYEITDDILDCMVPKLCVQLLVENAIKAVMTHREPWEIKVEGDLENDEWYIIVSDNGPGFDEEVDRSLRASMDQILESGLLPSLKIEGMGILNIFIRLYLLDGIPFVFDFGNKEEGGAFVKIGGYLRDKS